MKKLVAMVAASMFFYSFGQFLESFNRFELKFQYTSTVLVKNLEDFIKFYMI